MDSAQKNRDKEMPSANVEIRWHPYNVEIRRRPYNVEIRWRPYRMKFLFFLGETWCSYTGRQVGYNWCKLHRWA